MATKETTRKKAPQKNVRSGAKQQPRRRKKTTTAADLVYTQPGPFNRDRFILRLVTVVAVVLARKFFVGFDLDDEPACNPVCESAASAAQAPQEKGSGDD